MLVTPESNVVSESCSDKSRRDDLSYADVLSVVGPCPIVNGEAMPHITIEFPRIPAQRWEDPPTSTGWSMQFICGVDSGLAPVDALRTRAVGRNHVAIADRHVDNRFIAVIARIGPGRSDEQKKQLADVLIDAVEDFIEVVRAPRC